MRQWPVCPLGDLAEFINGFAFKPEDWGTEGLPIIRIQNLTGNQLATNKTTRLVPKKYLVADGDLLVSWSASLGVYFWSGGNAVLNQHIFKVIPREIVDKEFLFFAIQHALVIMESKTHGSTMVHIKKGDFESIPIQLPPLIEQLRIVDILNHAAGIRRLRQQALEKTRALIPALFIDMFGDPASNPKGWEVEKFKDAGTLDRGRSKHRPRNAPELFGGPYPFIQTGEVANSGGLITRWTTTYSELGLRQSKLWGKGTLCITIAANIAATGMLDFDACFPDSVVGFLPNIHFTTQFIQSWLHFLKPTLETYAPQLAQKNINLKILQDLPLYKPPIDLQRNYSYRVEEVYSLITQQERHLAQADALMQSLMARFFGGADTCSRPANYASSPEEIDFSLAAEETKEYR